ncbi:hypothetical protein [Trichloromonas sp.]|uniref:hypothetical protein n=1 Tax=Trichloromonas sp. TaxID=3069249 RepID=UPI002A3A6CA0|nr:hypothetical protein [Trichloromonas sp.]
MDNKYEWLFDDIVNLKQKIRFKDRIEYRVSGTLHNITGPAWVELNENGEKTGEVKYYINGGLLTQDDWSIIIRPLKLKKLMKKHKNNE